jgi:hypothetical protein
MRYVKGILSGGGKEGGFFVIRGRKSPQREDLVS